MIWKREDAEGAHVPRAEVPERPEGAKMATESNEVTIRRLPAETTLPSRRAASGSTAR